MQEYLYNALPLFFKGDDSAQGESTSYTVDTPISDVINDPAFGDWGRLIFPVDEGYMSGETLGDLRLTWYSNIDPNKTSDGIANWRTMKSRLESMSALGIPTEFHAYEGLSHGFGLGTGTVAEGWINDAVRFWMDRC